MVEKNILSIKEVEINTPVYTWEGKISTAYPEVKKKAFHHPWEIKKNGQGKTPANSSPRYLMVAPLFYDKKVLKITWRFINMKPGMARNVVLSGVYDPCFPIPTP